MSDIFDHMLDAYMDRDGDWCGDYSNRGSCRQSNPLFYHRHVKFESIVHETPKSYLFNIEGKDLWIPKKICRQLCLDDKTVYIHREIFQSIVCKHQDGVGDDFK